MTSGVFGSAWRLRLGIGLQGGLLGGLLLGVAAAPPALADDGFTDSSGRRVAVPPRVERVFPAGPPASVVVYMLAPDKLLGWTRAISPPERPFLPDRYADLPELGRLTGRGNTVNLEAVVGAKPDLVLVDGHLADSPRTFRTVGALLGVPETGERLARYAEDTLADVRRRMDGLPPDQRLKVYMARGPRGLQTGLRGSINMDVPQAGAGPFPFSVREMVLMGRTAPTAASSPPPPHPTTPRRRPRSTGWASPIWGSVTGCASAAASVNWP